jgi:uncharacterized protein (TIGR03435 family)
MVEERERACDEAVVELGSRPGVYAESLLKAVRFCVESPLVCVAGVTGADLSKRVRSIMTLRLERLGWGKKLVLLFVALITVTVPVLLGQGKAAQRMMLAAVNAAPKPVRAWAVAHSPIALEETPSTGLIAEVQADARAQSSVPLNSMVPAPIDAVPPDINFDVISFKRCPPDKFGTTKVDMPMTADYLAYHCESLSRIIYFAYYGSVKVYSLEPSYPKWVDDDRYEFIVKVAPEDIAAWQKLGIPARRLVIRKVLADVVKLKIRVDSSPKDIYALTAMKKVHLTTYKEGDQTKLPDGRVQQGTSHLWTNTTSYYQAFTMAGLAEIFSNRMDRVVADHTNLTGQYTFVMPVFGGINMEPDSHIGPGEDAPTVEDVFEQLGLQLKPAKGPVERLVIDHIEQPSVDGAEVQAPGDPKQVLHGVYKMWLEQDVRWVITAQEAEAFKHITNDEERDKFIEQFWQRRNPNPDAVDNAYRDEIYARIAYANENFAGDEPGWMTDRGHVYIAYGKPDEIDVQPADGTQIWRYRHLPGVGDNVVLKFTFVIGLGRYRLVPPVPAGLFGATPAITAQYSRYATFTNSFTSAMPLGQGAGAETPNPLKRRLTDVERMRQAAEAANPPKQSLDGAPGSGALPEMRFEVATVKPAAPLPSQPSSAGSPGMPARRIPGAAIVSITSDRASYRNITLKSLLMRAYGLEPFQVSGPAWMDSEHYDVLATIPEGTAKEDVPVMLQHLLAERFRVTLHSETKDQPGYILGIGKGGSKLKVSAERGKSAPMATAKFGTDSVIETMYGQTMPAFAHVLARMLERPVIDSTGLSGEFDIVLSLSKGVAMPGAQETAANGSPSEPDSSMASLFTAVQDLGLTLSSDKVPLKCIVVDKAEKIPTEN